MASVHNLTDLDTTSKYSRDFLLVARRLGATRYIACDGHYYPILAGRLNPVTSRFTVADPCRNYAPREVALIKRDRLAGHPLAHAVCETGFGQAKPDLVMAFLDRVPDHDLTRTG